MKTISISSNISMYPFGKGPMSSKNKKIENCTNFLHTTVSPPPMIEQEIAPPLHVWEKISRILDEQDRARLIGSPLSEILPAKSNQFHKYFFATLTAAVVVAVVWLLFKN